MISHKLLLHIFNFVLMFCGIGLFFSGIYLIKDDKRVLLSTLLGSANEKLMDLEQPLFYYLSMGLFTSGLLLIVTSLVGCWAAFINRFCILFIYFTLVILLLLTEFGICLIITMWPHCLGPNLSSVVLIKVLQEKYGVPGNEQFTVAMDLAQTEFECCAIVNNVEYDSSMWRLQGLGLRDWSVPFTCCHLENRNESGSYLDPKPLNSTQCQSVLKYDYETSRHLYGCLEKIEKWYHKQYIWFLLGTLTVAVVQFLVLLSVILNCTKLHKKSKTKQIVHETDTIYRKEIPTITELSKIRRDHRFAIEANTVGLWSSRWTPTQQY